MVQVRIENIWKRYGKTEALQDVSLGFTSGALTAILEQRGCAKTALLQSMTPCRLYSRGSRRGSRESRSFSHAKLHDGEPASGLPWNPRQFSPRHGSVRLDYTLSAETSALVLPFQKVSWLTEPKENKPVSLSNSDWISGMASVCFGQVPSST